MNKQEEQLPPNERREASSPDLPVGRMRRLVGHLAHPFFIGLLLALVTFAVYWPVMGYDFINVDDPENISANPRVQAGLNWNNVVWAFSTDYNISWYPLTWLSFMLDVTLFGKGAGGPHFMNLLFHTANTVLLFVLLRRLTGAHWRSALVAGLFALHPLRVESVAWVADRRDLLSSFFWLLTLIFYASYAERTGARSKEQGTGYKTAYSLPLAPYSWSLLFFALGLMSKPMLVTVPFVMLLLDYWPLGRVSSFKFQVSSSEKPALQGARPSTLGLRLICRLVWEKVPFFALSAISCIVTLFIYKKAGTVVTLEDIPLSERVENAFVSYVRYLGKTFWPGDLAIYHPYQAHWPLGQVILATALVAGLCVAAIGFGRRKPYGFVGWFWFLGTLVPVIGLVQWLKLLSICEHFTYMPLIGVFIILAWAAAEVLARWQRLKVVMVAVAVLVLCACAVQTRDQLRYWQNSETLLRHALAVTKDNYLAYNQLGTYLTDHGRKDEAMENYRKALQSNPKRPDILCNMGTILADEKRYDEAIADYEAALRINPNLTEARINLGITLADMAKAEVVQGKTDEAIQHFRLLLQWEPNHASAHEQLAAALVAKGELAGAVIQFREAVRCRPNDANTHYNLANALALSRDFSEAVGQYTEALRLAPDHVAAHCNLGSALAELGRREEAIAQFREALRIAPDSAEAQQQLRALGAPLSQ